MRYAVIITLTNVWEFDSDKLSDALTFARNLRVNGVECVVVKVIDTGEETEVPDIFDNI